MYMGRVGLEMENRLNTGGVTHEPNLVLQQVL